MNRAAVLTMCTLLIFTLCGNLSFAQKKKPEPKTKPGDEMIYKYLCAETDKLSKKEFDGATTLAEWKKRRPRLHKEYLYMLGLDPLPEKTPLKVTFTGTMEHEGIIIDNLHFQSRPGLYVTANLYRPKGTEQDGGGGAKGADANAKRKQGGAKTKRYPGVVYVCGHSNRGRNGNKSAFQDHGIWFARNGYICIVLDTLQLGEIPGVHHGTYGVPYNHLRAYGIKDKNKPETRWWWHSAGYTPAGVECWNGIRAIDYLVSRADVDGKRIAVTGISGGGAATFWIAAADERVACAVPVSGMSDLESYVKNKVINGHCDCMFLYNTFQWEWTTIAALVAPRPLLFANSDNDRIFPMDGNRRIAERLRKLYKWYGKEDHFAEYVSEGGHAYRPDLRIAIFKFINKHIKGEIGPVEDTANFKEIPGEKLRAFPTDADIPKDQINTKIDETFVPRAKVALPGKGELVGWKKRLVAELREKCFRGWPTKLSPAFPIETNGEITGFAEETWQIESPQPVYLTLLRQRDARLIKSKNLAILLSATNGKQIQSIAKDWKKLLDGDVQFIFPRGIRHGDSAWDWTLKSPPNYVERSHVLLGRTVDDARVHDIVAVIPRLDKDLERAGIKECGWRLVGHRQAGILAAYAALFEPSITEVVIIDPPTSHMQGPHFLNVLRVLDIAEALGLLAPRVKLTLINAKDRAFDRTAEIYRLAGAAEKFVRK